MICKILFMYHLARAAYWNHAELQIIVGVFKPWLAEFCFVSRMLYEVAFLWEIKSSIFRTIE